jgi:hypothetical protein
VLEPSLATQSCVDSIWAQMLRLMTNCRGSKQEETRLEEKERAVSFDWKSWRQEVEVGRSGSWNRDVSLRCWARATPKRERRFWQHDVLLVSCWVCLQSEVFHWILRT